VSNSSSSESKGNKYSWYQEVLTIAGPVVAGFQLAVAVIGYVGVGALASWVVSVWFPFTREMWQLLIQYMKLPFHLTNIEKDSLTTLVFFYPWQFRDS
jgi:hypothetical protein